MSDMNTPLSKVRGLGSAKEGTEHFWLQRLTAVANIPLILFFIITLVALNGADHATVIAYLGSPFICALMLLVILSVVIHMRLGMQIIIEDYVHGDLMKVGLVMANTFFAFFVGLVSAVALLKMSFGG